MPRNISESLWPPCMSWTKNTVMKNRSSSGSGPCELGQSEYGYFGANSAIKQLLHSRRSTQASLTCF